MRGEIGEGRRTRGAVVLGAIGVGLIVVWVDWWVQSVRQDSLLHGGRTWVGPLPFLAGDFKVHIDHVARIQVRGVNAYLIKDDPACATFPYPPMIPRLFAWVTAFSPAQAAAVWQGTVALFLGMAAYAAWRMRQEMGLWPVPLAVMAAALMYSTPAVMAMERGQCDPLVIPAVLAVAWLARARNARGTGRGRLARGDRVAQILSGARGVRPAGAPTVEGRSGLRRGRGAHRRLRSGRSAKVDRERQESC